MWRSAVKASARTFWAVVVGAAVGLAFGLGYPLSAWPQGVPPFPEPSGGFSLSPDGGVSSWQDRSGYVVQPNGGTSSFSPDGGYYIAPDGGYTTWQGAAPVILPDGSAWWPGQ